MVGGSVGSAVVGVGVVVAAVVGAGVVGAIVVTGGVVADGGVLADAVAGVLVGTGGLLGSVSPPSLQAARSRVPAMLTVTNPRLRFTPSASC
ncbi:MAG: hypothetical protein H0U21_11350 [Acidimicrobiia bacterium]|nr:hypothetical protein [Acidimicrobiia bacterium]